MNISPGQAVADKNAVVASYAMHLLGSKAEILLKTTIQEAAQSTARP